MEERWDMTERAGLNECPFCGGVAVIFEMDAPSEFVVQCLDCGAGSPIVTAIGDDPTAALGQGWNRRQHRITSAVSAVLAERQRQIDVEGWTPRHDDDANISGQMADAAACYAFMAGSGVDLGEYHLPVPARWPWKPSFWKPKTRRGDLVKAGALILAEIERLDRIEEAEPF